MYDKHTKPTYWGEEAKRQANLHKDLVLLGNFKLFLCPDSLEKFYGQNEDIEILKENCGFDGEDTSPHKKKKMVAFKVIADYLKLFKDHVIEYIIAKEMGENFNLLNRKRLLRRYKIRYVITVPAMWDTSARDTMAQAAIEATLIKQAEVNQLLIISEPEAAALYCEKKFTDYVVNSEGNINDTNFIVCDAGGGTVDLVTFNLNVNENKEPMICQIGDGVGDTCGSTYLDVRFKDYLIEFYKSFGVNMENLNLDQIMLDFVTNKKVKNTISLNVIHSNMF